VSDWTEGYVADIDYTYGYYEELNPLRLLVPFLNVGLQPPEIATACELGYGQGVSVNLHAAASSARTATRLFLPSSRSASVPSGCGVISTRVGRAPEK